MDHISHIRQQSVTPLHEAETMYRSDYQAAADWLAAREQACATLQQHTEALRQLMELMRTFDYQTSIETVMQVQSRSEALRWLTLRIERDVQRLDKGYREAAQREQFLQDKAMLTAV